MAWHLAELGLKSLHCLLSATAKLYCLLLLLCFDFVSEHFIKNHATFLREMTENLFMNYYSISLILEMNC